MSSERRVQQQQQDKAASSSLLQMISGPLDNEASSPVTDLARNLIGLSTGSRGTPRRRISWSNSEDTPETQRVLRKPGLFLGNAADSPQYSHLNDSPMFQDRLLRDVSAVADNCLNTTGSRVIRRVRTLPPISRPQLQEAFGKENIPSCQPEHTSNEDPTQAHQQQQQTDIFHSKVLSTSSTTPLSSTSSSAYEKKTFGRIPFSPLLDSGSQDSGCGLHEHAQPENAFLAPLSGPLPRRIISPLKTISNPQSLRMNSTGSSIGYSSSGRSSVSAVSDGELDDGFLDVFDMETLESEAPSSVNDYSLPRDFYRLLRDPLASGTSGPKVGKFHHASESGQADELLQTGFCDDSPKKPPIRRCLSMIEESPGSRPYTSPRDKLLNSLDRNNNFGNIVRKPEDSRKRLLQDEDDGTFKKPCEPPLLAAENRPHENTSKPCHETKRRKSVTYLTKSPSDSLVLPSHRILLQRSHSETEAITSALQKSSYNPNLIGDCSGTYLLPLVKGKHDDLKSISCTTLSHLIEGKYKDQVDQFEVVDCRYPYEFEGGHIKGACNLYTKEAIYEKLINHQPAPSSSQRHKILVFHCEFSSERGPNLCRFLRNKDREANKDNYPQLFHPEIYLLEGGYREFFSLNKELCVPQSYLPMLSKDHEKDLRKFRSKSKSWSGDTRSRLSLRPGLKL